MKTYFLKVREKFIDLTRTKIKKFEYRLGTIDRKDIKIGDTLVLISNQNSKKYVRVTVKAINHYENWSLALDHDWQENFKDLFNEYDELLHECYKFYKKEDVDKFGIIRFAIEPILSKINNMDILLDTNIIIKREGLLSSCFEISKLFRWFDKQKENKFIHIQTINEINKYENEEIKDSILKKINAYNVYGCSDSIIEFQDEYFKKVISEFTRNQNADVDNILLWEIYCNNFDLLVTDDKEMLTKAEKLFIRENVKTAT